MEDQVEHNSGFHGQGGTVFGRAGDLVVVSGVALALSAYLAHNGLTLLWLAYYGFCMALIWSIASRGVGQWLSRLNGPAWFVTYSVIFCGACLCYGTYYHELKSILTGTSFLYGEKGDEYFYYQAARSSGQFLEGRDYLAGLEGLYAPFRILSGTAFGLLGRAGIVPLNLLASFCAGLLISSYLTRGASPAVGRQCALVWALYPEVYLWSTSLYKEPLVAFALTGLLCATTWRGTLKRGAGIAFFGAMAIAVRMSAGAAATAACLAVTRRRPVLASIVGIGCAFTALALSREGSALLDLFLNEQRLSVLIGSRFASVEASGVLYGALILIALAGVIAETVQPILMRFAESGDFGEINAYLAAPALYWLVIFPHFIRGLFSATPLGRRSALIYVLLAALIALSLLIFTGRHRFMLMPFALVAVGFGLHNPKGEDKLEYSVLQLALLCVWAVAVAVRS